MLVSILKSLLLTLVALLPCLVLLEAGLRVIICHVCGVHIVRKAPSPDCYAWVVTQQHCRGCLGYDTQDTLQCDLIYFVWDSSHIYICARCACNEASLARAGMRQPCRLCVISPGHHPAMVMQQPLRRSVMTPAGLQLPCIICVLLAHKTARLLQCTAAQALLLTHSGVDACWVALQFCHAACHMVKDQQAASTLVFYQWRMRMLCHVQHVAMWWPV